MQVPTPPPELDRAAEFDAKYGSGIKSAESIMVTTLPQYDADLGMIYTLATQFIDNMRQWQLYMGPEAWKGYKRGQLAYLSRCSKNLSAASINMDDAARNLAKTAATWRTRYYAFLTTTRKELSEARKKLTAM